MYKRVLHIMFGSWLLLSCLQAGAQNAMPDTVCMGTTRIYKVNDASVPSAYTWRINGLTQASVRNEIVVTWNIPGTYQLSVTEHGSNGCDGDERSGTVYVRPLPVANAGPDAVVCPGTVFRLQGSGGTSYQWSPSTYLSNPLVANPVVSAPSLAVLKYALKVTDAFGCQSATSDTVVIRVSNPVRVFAGRDTMVAINQPLQLHAADLGSAGFTSYTWSPSFGLNNPSLQDPVAVLDRETRYVVTARTADGCEARDDISIKVFQKADLYVPTAFTPDGDGLNDYARVIGVGIRELRYFSIYSRWGELVFTTRDLTAGWNGVYKGQRQDGNVFVWMAEAVDYKGNIIQKKGTITLIR